MNPKTLLRKMLKRVSSYPFPEPPFKIEMAGTTLYAEHRVVVHNNEFWMGVAFFLSGNRISSWSRVSPICLSSAREALFETIEKIVPSESWDLEQRGAVNILQQRWTESLKKDYLKLRGPGA